MENWIYERLGVTVQEFPSLDIAKKLLSPFFAEPGKSEFCWEELDDNGVFKGMLLHHGRDTGFRLHRQDVAVAVMAVAA